MPLYEYKCQSCGEVFETIQKFSDTPIAVHEKCGGQVERLISTSALQFKGSGWYVNDYGKGNSKEPKPKSDSASDSKADSKNGAAKTDKSNGSSSSSESSNKTETSSKTESSSTPSTASKPDSK